MPCNDMAAGRGNGGAARSSHCSNRWAPGKKKRYEKRSTTALVLCHARVLKSTFTLRASAWVGWSSVHGSRVRLGQLVDWRVPSRPPFALPPARPACFPPARAAHVAHIACCAPPHTFPVVDPGLRAARRACSPPSTKCDPHCTPRRARMRSPLRCNLRVRRRFAPHPPNRVKRLPRLSEPLYALAETDPTRECIETGARQRNRARA